MTTQYQKILFLDVDGVLNGAETTSRTPVGYTGVDEDKCLRLRHIVHETGCKIVLSSTWRKIPEILPYLWANLGQEVFNQCIDRTPILGASRGSEIDAWICQNYKPERFVILDDDLETYPWRQYQVATGWSEGLTDEKADEVILRLNSK